ncbi:MAG TPA: DUF2125 domain-containing protein [Stellaceae bacterium]|nr:DUF2125 domain-containing protein [Stellaceae bacterium]
MRRSTVFRALGAVLVIAGAAYSAFWWIAAGKIAAAASAWREAARQQSIDASWQGMRVAGYPLSFRLELTDFAIKAPGTVPPVEAQAPLLTASVRPWDFHTVRFATLQGVDATAEPQALAKLTAQSASGAAAFNDDGTTVWLSLHQAKAGGGLALAAKTVHLWVTLPSQAPATHQDTEVALAIDAHELTPPLTPPGFSGAIDDLAFGVTMRGAFPSGPLRQAATAWRDSGGTLELDHLHLRWGETDISGSGTLALDNNLQPVGGFSGGVSGFDQLLSALVASGRIKAGDARVARLALAMLAKAGPDGRPEISTSFAIQDGQMYLGPAKLGPAPRIEW